MFFNWIKKKFPEFYPQHDSGQAGDHRDDNRRSHYPEHHPEKGNNQLLKHESGFTA